MNKTLKRLLEDHANERPSGYHILLRPLSAAVQYALAWPVLMETEVVPDDIQPRFIYIIREAEKAVGAVELLEDNLDTFILPAYRGKGLFSKSMREYILPHILQRRPLQRITIRKSDYGERRFETLKKIFVSLGFEILREDTEIRMVIDASKRPVNKFIAGENRPIDPKRKEILMKDFLWFAYRLMLIRSELEICEGMSYITEDFSDLIKRLKDYGRRW